NNRTRWHTTKCPEEARKSRYCDPTNNITNIYPCSLKFRIVHQGGRVQDQLTAIYPKRRGRFDDPIFDPLSYRQDLSNLTFTVVVTSAVHHQFDTACCIRGNKFSTNILASQ